MKGLEVVVGVSGASGGQLARRFVELAVTAPELSRLHLILSDPALRVARNEIDPSILETSDWLERLSMPRRAKTRIVLHDNRDVAASIASGSYPTSGMAVIPCSGGTLGSIANGISRDLVGRAAEVMLKERRPLLLAFRESPYSLVAIENMRRDQRGSCPNSPDPRLLHRRRLDGAVSRRLLHSSGPLAGPHDSRRGLRMEGREAATGEAVRETRSGIRADRKSTR